jgi:glycosyltransferase involved in cell wall biosynthesis
MSTQILYLNHTSQMSGGERSLLLLLQGLPAETLAVLACPSGPLSEAARAAEVPWVPVTGTAGSLKLHPVYTAQAVRDLTTAALQVRNVCDELSIDLVHANSIRAGLIAALARRLGGAPTVAHIRDVLPPGKLSSLTIRSIHSGADAIVANSRYTREHLPVAPAREKAHVVYNPVDLRRFDRDAVSRATVRSELGLSDDVRLLVVVAQITPWKGQDTAIRALAELLSRGRAVHLALAGSAKFVEKATRFDNEAFLRDLHALTAELGVQEQVSFLGEREDVPAVLAAADVLLMPSWQEPFGRAVIEAMAMGTAVIATDVGGIEEIVTDGQSGMLAPPTDTSRWVQAIDLLLGDPDLLHRLGEAGRERAQDFGVQQHVDSIMEIYESVTAQRTQQM